MDLAWVLVCLFAGATARTPFTEKDSRLIRMKGDVILGGIFPMHEHRQDSPEYPCGAVKEEKGIQRLEAMLYAIDLINNDPQLLPNLSLGALIIDSCSSDTYALEQSMEFVRYYMNQDMSEYKCENGKPPTYIPHLPVTGVIGASFSVVSIMVANILRLFKIPQISYASTSTELSDKSRFEYFSRVVPPDNFQAMAMAEIARALDWRYASTVAVEGEYGEKGIASFISIAAQLGICVAVSQKILRNSKTEDFDRIIEALIQKPQARVVVMFVDEDNVRKLLQATIRANRTGHFYFIASDSWGAKMYPVRDQEFAAVNTITVLPHRTSLTGFDEYYLSLRPKLSPDDCLPGSYASRSSTSETITNCRNRWFNEFWSQHHKCSFAPNSRTPCTGSEGVHGYEQEGLVPFVVDAVYAIAYAIDAIIRDVCGGPDLCPALQPAPLGGDLLKYIHNVSFVGLQGTRVRFNKDGDAYGFYNVYQYQQSGKRLATMLYAIDLINNDPQLLPNLSLGALIIDSCSSDTYALEQSMEFVRYYMNQDMSEYKCENGKPPTYIPHLPVTGVIGASFSVVSIMVANILRLFKIPQISYASTSTELSDKSRFEYFSRVVPPDNFQAMAMAEIARALDWRYASTVAVEGEYGEKGIASFISIAAQLGICVAWIGGHPRSLCSEPCPIGYVRNYQDACCWACVKCPDDAYVNNDTCITCEPGWAPSENKTFCFKLEAEVIDWLTPWALVPLTFSACGILCTLFTTCVFIKYNKTPVIMASGRELCYVLLVGVLSCYCMSFVVLARPTVYRCALLRVGLGLCLSICYSAIFTKTNRISRIFNRGVKSVQRPIYTSPLSQIMISLSVVLVQLLGSIGWLLIESPDIREIHPFPLSAVLTCKVSTFSLIMSLVYNMILIILCTLYAFKTRKIPENFNEAKYIGFTMYSTCIVWLAFLPIYFGTNNDYKIQISSMCMCLNISASVALGCLFTPKVYLVLFQPYKNVRPGNGNQRGGMGEANRLPYSMRFGGVRSQTMQSMASLSKSSPQTVHRSLTDDNVAKPQARVVVMFVDEDNVRKLLQATIRANRTGHFYFIASDSWGAKMYPVRDQEFAAVNTITVLPHRTSLTGFDEYYLSLRPKLSPDDCLPGSYASRSSTSETITNCRNRWFNEFWSQHHKCSFAPNSRTPCTGSEGVHGYEQEGLVPFVVDAVYAIAYAIDAIIRDVCGGPDLCPALQPAPLGGDLLKYIHNVSFVGLQGTRVRFNKDGDAYGFYNVYQYQQSGKSEPCPIGYVRNYQDACCWACVKCPDDAYVNNDTCITCEPGWAPSENKTFCFKLEAEVIDWLTPWALVPLTFSACGILCTLFTTCVFIKYNKTPVIMASGRELCYVLLVGVLSCYCMSFVVLARPTVYRCALLRVGLGLCLSICYSAIFTKTNRISRIFNRGVKSVQRPIYTSPLSQIMISLSVVLVQLLGSIGWLLIESPDIREIHPFPLSAVLTCKVSTFSLIMSLVYNMILIILCTLYAFKTRKIPENFNEAKYIGFTMYSTCIVWLAFLPIYFGTNNDYKIQISSMCMCLNISASVALGCLFTPKVYLVLFQPYKNVRPGNGNQRGGMGEANRLPYSMRFGGVRSQTMQSMASLSKSSPQTVHHSLTDDNVAVITPTNIEDSSIT
uniref:Putative metabotropic glutamate receptor n=1 Tax=Lutzomyia longipalpis TaxID=7200 RepID=A0A1B0CRB2_LUTLO